RASLTAGSVNETTQPMATAPLRSRCRNRCSPCMFVPRESGAMPRGPVPGPKGCERMAALDKGVASRLLLRLGEGPDVRPAPAVPGALDRRLDLGHGQRLLKPRLPLLAVRHRSQELGRFDELEVLVAHADGRARVEALVVRMLRSRLDEHRAVMLLGAVG